ncbi:MAG TPA: hypothetical protein VGB63_02350 [Pedobacter sp.]|jgi:hypothetical protein
MKTSNIIFTLAIVFFFGMLVSYNLELKAAYTKGDFRSPFYGYDKLEFKNFDKIKINAANALVVRISGGAENAVYVNTEVKSKVKVTEFKKVLSIDAKDERIHDSEEVLIICSDLKEVTTNAIEVSNWNPKTKEMLNKKAAVWNSGTFIHGFNQDSLNLHVNDYTSVTLERNQIKKIRALVGTKEGAIFTLVDSKIEASDINVRGTNYLRILNTEIQQRKEVLSDSSQITLSGRLIKSRTD